MSDTFYLHRPSDPDEDGERWCVYCSDLWGCGCCGGEDPHTPTTEPHGFIDIGWPCPTVRQGLPERAILLDLIAELRDEHQMDNGGDCMTCDTTWPCASDRAANFAEARLREIGDE